MSVPKFKRKPSGLEYVDNAYILQQDIMNLCSKLSARWARVYQQPIDKLEFLQADFDVKFTKAVLDSTDVLADVILSDGKIITFGTKNLSTVGDISKLDFEVTNNFTMYDANVSIACSTTGAKKDYYEITQSVKGPIVGKTTEKGNVQVKLLKASVELTIPSV